MIFFCKKVLIYINKNLETLFFQSIHNFVNLLMEENNNFQEIQEPDEIYNNENPIDELTPFDRFAKVLTSPTEAFDGLLSSTKKEINNNLGFIVFYCSLLFCNDYCNHI